MTEKQRRFVEAYQGKAAGNATEAARLAGYQATGETEEKRRETWEAIGRENLGKPRIAKALAAYRAELAKEARVDAAYLIGRLKIEIEGTGKDTNSAARVSAIDKLAKHLGFYSEDNAQRAANIFVDLTSDDD